jgi:mannan endo-1,4-beta-mannosidase
LSADAVSRRRLAAGLGAAITFGGLGRAFSAASPSAVQIDDLASGAPISPFIYGSNETGTMDGAASVHFDFSAGVTIRRLGGDLMTCYNWRTNATHAGKDFENANGDFLLETLQVEKSKRADPAAVIDAFVANSRSLGAQSLLTLPLAGFVAADFNGPVAPEEAAPSRRFAPIDWSSNASAPNGAVNIPELLALLVARHGGGAGGLRGYYLDNEPGLWARTHPRVVKSPTTVKSLIAKSLIAAKAIKAADPDAFVLGPASWGPTEMVTLQNAPDWDDYRSQHDFLAVYLDAFRRESERAGRRLLDFLDVHWYPQSRHGALFRTENPDMASALLDAPRSLDEAGFCEDSWVAEALGCGAGPGVRLPLLPSLRALAQDRFPGVGLSIGEFNYGGAGLLASGLAVADALGRFGRCGVAIATHWGALAGWIGEAYRLYRQKDSAGESFGATSLPVSGAGPDLSLFAARTDKNRVQLIVINKSERPARLQLRLASSRAPELRETLGFDKSRPRCGPIEEATESSAAGLLLTAPPFSARRYRLA